MIIGTGTDLANIDRINKVLIRHGDRFRNRVFTKNEQAKARRRKAPFQSGHPAEDEEFRG